MNRACEIQAVKELGERIGYGNMMDIASALWSNELKYKYDIDLGAFVPAVLPQLKIRDRKRALDRLKWMMQHVKEIQ
jgi:alcohol dehydrogenase YqhD (iron-dependent ADH family)